jgi:hypothetical protein
VPVEFTAIVPKPLPGAELACLALSHEFEDDGAQVERGVISYYATRTLPLASTVASWVQLIDAAAGADLARGRIKPFHQPSLRIRGDAARRLPGTATAPGRGAPVAPRIRLVSGAATQSWSVMSREDGCMPLALIVRGDRLPREPVSPEDYADMMRARGHQPTLGPPPALPPDLVGKVVMVKVRDGRAPVFVRNDVCAQLKEK